MDIDKLGKLIMNNDWGTQVANGDNFYRMLFKLEKKRSMSVEDINILFASYKVWKNVISQLTAECHSNSTMEDRKAIQYSETLDDDIIKHIETILTTVKCDNPNFVQELAKKADETAKMIE